MTESTRLASEQLYRACDPSALEFETTASLDAVEPIELQSRAGEALDFGIGVRHAGYNIFALGPPGTGKRHQAGEWAGMTPV